MKEASQKKIVIAGAGLDLFVRLQFNRHIHIMGNTYSYRLFLSREKISLFRLSLYVITLSIILIYIPRKLGPSLVLFPFAEDIYRIFMVFMAFFIVIKRDTFAKGYKK